MLFNSWEYILFFPIVCVFFFLLTPKYRLIWLSVASYYFYMSWNAKYALLMLFVTIISYFCALLMNRNRKFYLWLGIGTNVLILIVFKYLTFIIGSINMIFEAISVGKIFLNVEILLPVGISFYVFQAIGYLIDVYRQDIYPEKCFIRYTLFLAFFPQLVAGPIERAKNILEDLKKIQEGETRFEYERFIDGIVLILYGLFLKMVIADRICILVDTVYKDYSNFSGLMLLIAAIGFAIQIYCDFSGYSLIAIGSAKILGVTLMNNFLSPYFSFSVTEFWRRWHVSLSSWFRDYVYIPLGGNRCSKFRNSINLMITFLVS